MDGYRERLKGMGQPVPDERYEDIILQALPAEYEKVRTASYERRDFHLADIRRMMSALYIDCLSRPNNSLLVAGRGVAMQATGGDNSIIKCHYCGKSRTPPEKLCVLDSGPVQRRKSANDSFNTVKALEKETRRR